MATDKNFSLTPDDLKDLLKTAIEETKKPYVSEADVRKLAQDQAMRADTAQQQVQIQENKKAQQRVCTHKHRKGDTHCVFIQDDLGGYVLCQRCQAVIRAGDTPKGYAGMVIYNTDLFNRLFQDTGTSNGVWD